MGKLVADIIVETLQKAGVKHCYGVVGDTLNLIARSLEKSESSGCRCDMKKPERSPRRRRLRSQIA
jgi:thiamine pyrophosphate-dependent acetolactate synthase large subunit-like protein